MQSNNVLLQSVAENSALSNTAKYMLQIIRYINSIFRISILLYCSHMVV